VVRYPRFEARRAFLVHPPVTKSFTSVSVPFDYDTASTVTHIEADTDVTRAEVAFLDWAAVQTDPESETFLVELLCRGIPKR
jgi:hypothetical protein